MSYKKKSYEAKKAFHPEDIKMYLTGMIKANEDVDLESCILKALIVNPEHIDSVSEVIEKKHFSHAGLANVFEDLVLGGVSYDDHGYFKDFDPPDNLAAAIQQFHALFKKRRLAETLETMLKGIHEKSDPDEALFWIGKVVAEYDSLTPVVKAPSISAGFNSLLDTYCLKQQTQKERGHVGLKTPFETLNKYLGGLQPGIHTFSGPPAIGKTTISLQTAVSVAVQGYPSFYLNLDDDQFRLELKAICMMAGLDFSSYVNALGSAEELAIVKQKHEPSLENLRILNSRSFDDLQVVKKLIQRAMNISGKSEALLVVDYLQFWAGLNRKTDLFRFDVSTLLSGLRQVSQELQIPILVISSQNRAAYSRDSKISDDLSSLKESGELEYTSDSVCFLKEVEVRAPKPDETALELTISKNRYGAKGALPLVFKKAKGIIEEPITATRTGGKKR